MNEIKRAIETVTPPTKAPVVIDDYGIQVTDNPDWKQMRGDGSALLAHAPSTY